MAVFLINRWHKKEWICFFIPFEIKWLVYISSMAFSAATLPDSADALKGIIVHLHAEFEEQLAWARAGYERQHAILLEQIRLLLSQIYGPKSEKIAPDNGAVQLSLFDMPEPAGLEPEPAQVEISGHTRRKPGRRPLPEHLPRIEVIHDIPEAEKVCACGCALFRIGEEVSEQLDVVPARIQVIRNIRLQYACRHCEGVEDPTGKTVKIAPVHPQITPKSIVSAGLPTPAGAASPAGESRLSDQYRRDSAAGIAGAGSQPDQQVIHVAFSWG